MHARASRAPLAPRRQHPGDPGRPGASSTSGSAPSPPGSAPAPSTAQSCSCRWRRSSAPRRRSRRPTARSAPPQLASAAPYLQPLALSAATRKQASKALLRELRDGIATVTGEEPAPLERLVRVRGPDAVHDRGAHRRVLRAAPAARRRRRQRRRARARPTGGGWRCAWSCRSAPTSRRRSAWPAACPSTLPFGPNLAAQMASSFVNRVTPGQRRRDGAQRAVPAEGGRAARGGGDRHRPQRGRRRHRAPRPAAAVRRVGRARATPTRSRSRRAASCW